MADTQSGSASLRKLVLFLVLLSAAGSIVSGVTYALVDLPIQHAMRGPANSGSTVCSMDECMNECNSTAVTGSVITTNGYCTGYCRAALNRSEMLGLCSR